MTTGLTLQHLYSQQQTQYPTPQQPSPMRSMAAKPPHHHLPSHHHHLNPNGPPAHHHGGQGQDEFVADPLPFNYEDIDGLDDRYRPRTNGANGGMPNLSNMANMPGQDKVNQQSQHSQQSQHTMRYGSLLSGMPPQYHEPAPTYNDGNSQMHHAHSYESRRDHNAMDRNMHPKDTSSYHYMPHAHSHAHGHSEQDSRSNSHYGVPELQHNGMGHGNIHSLYHQGPSNYSTNNAPQTQQSSHNSLPYTSLMTSHHNMSGPPSSSLSSVVAPPKKEMPPSYHGDYLDSRSHSSSSMTHMPSSSSLSHLTSSSSSATQSQTQEAVIKVKTTLKGKYWRNGRRNLQCFPACRVFGDYSQIKIEDLKQHDFMWGKCRGSLIAEVTLNSNATFDDILLLGRVHSLENIPVPFDEAVIRECMIGRVVEPDVMDVMKEQWIAGERLPDFINQNNNQALYEFKPKVWKYTDDMVHGKCKRRNVRYYVQFEAFVPVLTGDRRCYVCIGSGMSSSFEVGSSRVLARQKRKASNNAQGDDDDDKGSNEDENDSRNGRPTKKVAVDSYPI